MSRRAGEPRGVRGRVGKDVVPRTLRQVRARLAAAKQALLAASETLRAVEARLGAPSWDPREPFMARRGQALRAEATVAFARTLDALHALLGQLAVTDSLRPVSAGGTGAPHARRLQAEIRQELRYLQRAFDGGSLLLADALERFGARR